MENGIVPRDKYMRILRESRDLPFIKVITGMRRCGKSTLMAMMREEISDSRVPENRIFSMNLDDETEHSADSYTDLIDIVKSAVPIKKGTYILLDEIQNVKGWERAVESFYAAGADVYITGSNSRMLSSDIATLLSGRCLEIKVYPLSFREFVRFRKQYGTEDPSDVLLEKYMRRGGLPAVAAMIDSHENLIPVVLSGIYSTAYVKDVVERNEIRNAALLGNISRFLMKNIGDRTSVRSTVSYLTGKGIRTSAETVDGYILALESAMLFYRAKRFNTKTKDYLVTSDKFYVSDIGIRNNEVGFCDEDLDGVMENIVFMELLFRFGNASVCSVNGNEVDFMTRNGERTEYFQVTVSMADPATKERELRSLNAIKDNYPKTIVTFDRYPVKDIGGIRVVNLLDFLLEDY